jgi:hypothetical protein
MSVRWSIMGVKVESRVKTAAIDILERTREKEHRVWLVRMSLQATDSLQLNSLPGVDRMLQNAATCNV